MIYWILERKEYILLGICFCYLGYYSFKNWGKKYEYFGLSRYETENFIKKTCSGEERCRKIIEDIFGLPFEKVRPSFLRNPKTGRNLELDCFNRNIITGMGKGLAFEIDGAQHSTFVPHYHINEQGFEDALARDQLKETLCKKNGILLIRIPYTVVDKEGYIKKRLRENNLSHYLTF